MRDQRFSGSNPIKGRGASGTPANRFDRIEYIPEEEDWREDGKPSPKTIFYQDNSKTIITYNESPDVYFDASINPYRGCEHGCIYCYARPMHEYMGFSAGLDFETKVFVKENARELLKKELGSRKWKPQAVSVSGATDPYQPAEKHFKLTRECLKVFLKFRNPVQIVTKSHLITRDIDLLGELAQKNLAAVFVSITTLDSLLGRLMEPRSAQPHRKLAAVRKLVAAGIPTGVLVAPVIPALTDHEMPAILREAAAAGATFAGYILLRLPHAVSDLFQTWVSQHYPDRREKILNRLRETRGGELYDAEFFTRMKGSGFFAGQMENLFQLGCRAAGLKQNGPALSVTQFRIPGNEQLSLFDED